jgi:CDP-diglyceride synthetase
MLGPNILLPFGITVLLWSLVQMFWVLGPIFLLSIRSNCSSQREIHLFSVLGPIVLLSVRSNYEYKHSAQCLVKLLSSAPCSKAPLVCVLSLMVDTRTYMQNNSKNYTFYISHICWEPELWCQRRRPLLGNGSVNTVAQWTSSDRGRIYSQY